MVEGRDQNLATGGAYTIRAGGEERTVAVAEGKLTDRLRLLQQPELAVASQGYRGFLRFEPGEWAETITVGPVEVVLDFQQPYSLSRAGLWFTGALESVVAEASADGENWQPAATAPDLHETGFREVAELSLELADTAPARYLRLTMVAQGEAALVEAEVWGAAAE